MRWKIRCDGESCKVLEFWRELNKAFLFVAIALQILTATIHLSTHCVLWNLVELPSEMKFVMNYSSFHSLCIMKPCGVALWYEVCDEYRGILFWVSHHHFSNQCLCFGSHVSTCHIITFSVCGFQCELLFRSILLWRTMFHALLSLHPTSTSPFNVQIPCLRKL